MFFSFCWFIGFLFLLKYGFNLIRLLRVHFTTNLDNIDFSKKYGKDSYVLITGSSDGIGKEFAYFFASKGMNLILWSRNLKKLESVKEDLKKKYKNIKIELIANDFENSYKENFFTNQLETIKDLDVSILINNVGYIATLDENYKADFKGIKNTLNINVLPQAVLTQWFITRVNNRKNHSSLIDLSSTVSLIPIQKMQIYGLSKRFNDYFSNSVHNGFGNDNFDVICIQPGPVQTPMGEMGKSKLKLTSTFFLNLLELFFVSPSKCVEGSIKQLGKSKCCGGAILHSILRLTQDAVRSFSYVVEDILCGLRFLRHYIE